MINNQDTLFAPCHGSALNQTQDWGRGKRGRVRGSKQIYKKVQMARILCALIKGNLAQRQSPKAAQPEHEHK